MAKHIIVTGSRTHTDFDLIWGELREHVEPGTVIIQGGSCGADSIAVCYAREKKCAYVTYYADWNTHGKAAGPKRNQQMIDDYPGALVLAFPQGQAKGTKDCIARAKKAGMEVKVFECLPK